MVEFVSWIGVVVIAIFAIVGFTGVVATMRAERRPSPAPDGPGRARRVRQHLAA